MRDGRRDSEKFEFSLEPRQLALLFLLTLVIMTLVFALGIIVGRGLKSPTGIPALAQVEGESVAEEAPTDATSPEDGAMVEDPEAPQLKFFANGASEPSRVARAVAKTEKMAPEEPDALPAEPVVAAAVPDKPVKASKVEAKSAKEKTKATSGKKEVAAKSGTKFTIQVSAFQDRHQADRLVSSLKQKGYQAFIAKAEIPGKGTWYRVRIGQYASRDAAQGIANTLKRKEGISTYVTLH